MDKIMFIGNLGSDPKEQTTNDGKTLVKLNIAVTHKVKGEKTTEWRQCTCSGNNATFAKTYLKKGRTVLVEGKPSVRAYKNKLEEIVAVMDVWVDNLEPIGSMRDGTEGGGQPEAGGAAPNKNAYVEVTDEQLPF